MSHVLVRRWCLLTSLALTLIGLDPASAKEDWAQVQSPNFLILSDSGEETGIEIATELEQLRLVFDDAWPNATLDSPRPVIVFALQDRRRIRELIPRERFSNEAGGYFLRRPHAHYAVIRTDQRTAETRRILYHEYYHVLNALNLGNVPRCLNEGFAEFWASTQIKDDTVEIGRPAVYHLDFVRDLPNIIGAGQLLTARQALSREYGTDRDLSAMKNYALYSQCYAFAHFLIIGDGTPDNRRALFDYLRLIRLGVDEETAIATAIEDLDAWDRGFRQYLRERRLIYYVSPAPEKPDASSFETRKLAPAEVLTWRGELLATLGLHEDAISLLEEAAELDPALAKPLEILGAVYSILGEDRRASRNLERAMELDNYSFLAPYFRARHTERGGGTRARYLEQSIEMDPNYALPLFELSQILNRRGLYRERALELIERALIVEPDNLVFRVSHAEYLFNLEQIDETKRAIRRASGWTLEPRLEAQLEELRQEVARYEARNDVSSSALETPEIELLEL